MSGNGKNSQAPDGLPCSPDAEAAVLGAMLIDTDAILTLRAELEPADFVHPGHIALYEAMLALAQVGSRSDLVTLGEELDRRGTNKTVGGPAYLAGLIASTPSSIHAVHYARLVRRCRVQRDVIAASTVTVKAAYQQGMPVEQTIAEARSRLLAAERLLNRGAAGLDMRRSLDWYLDVLQRRHEDRDKPKLQFPWRELSDLMPYLDAGTLVGIVAEPGVGKTAFLECCAEYWVQHGWKVAFFHYEWSDQGMLDRRMQRHSGVPIKTLQLGAQLTETEWAAVLSASTRMEAWPGQLMYFHCPGWPASRVLGAAGSLLESEGVDVVIVDYLNKMPVRETGGLLNAAQARGQDIENFKVFLEETGTVGLMAAQFNMAAKHARRRSLADVRDTAELDDKANVGIVIDRPLDASGSRESAATFRVTKCNSGRDGVASSWFDGPHIRFTSVQYEPRAQLTGAGAST